MLDVVSPSWVPNRNRSDALPDQIADIISQAIKQGELLPGEKLPGELRLAKLLKVSRSTLRSSIQILITNGVLERIRGVGTFVCKHAPLLIKNDIASLRSATDILFQQGFILEVTKCHVEEIPAKQLKFEFFEIPETSFFLHLTRTRSINGKPFIYSNEYIPNMILKSSDIPLGKNSWSLFGLLKDNGVIVNNAICNIRAVTTDDSLSQNLDVPKNYPLLLIEQTVFDTTSRPVLHSENYHNSLMMDFQLIRRA